MRMNKKDDIRLNVTILASVALLSIIYDIAENKYYKFSIPTGLLMLGSAIAVSGLFYLLFRKTFAEICTIKTTCIALGVSAFLGILLDSSLYEIFLLDFHYNKRPIALMLNSMLLILSWVALSWLIYLYKRARIKRINLHRKVYC